MTVPPGSVGRVQDHPGLLERQGASLVLSPTIGAGPTLLPWACLKTVVPSHGRGPKVLKWMLSAALSVSPAPQPSDRSI